MENKVFNSEVHTSFKRGADGVVTYFFSTGYITCATTESTLILYDVLEEKEKIGETKESWNKGEAGE